MEQLAQKATGQGDGWCCPDCGRRHLRVTNVWTNRDGTKRRLKKCRNCGYPVRLSEVNEG